VEALRESSEIILALLLFMPNHILPCLNVSPAVSNTETGIGNTARDVMALLSEGNLSGSAPCAAKKFQNTPQKRLLIVTLHSLIA
jgi:hypothetical protein